MQFGKCRFVNFRRGCHHQVFGLLIHWENDDLADIRLIRQQHHDAVDARCGATMRRRAIAEGIQHAAEAMFHFFRRLARDFKGTDHDIRAMIADGTG